MDRTREKLGVNAAVWGTGNKASSWCAVRAMPLTLQAGNAPSRNKQGCSRQNYACTCSPRTEEYVKLQTQHGDDPPRSARGHAADWEIPTHNNSQSKSPCTATCWKAGQGLT